VLSVYLPPLRERRDDIPLLVRRFVSEFSALHDREFQGISADALALLVEYAWPGNVRELRNLVESMVVLAHGREIVADDIPRSIREGGGRRLLPVHVGPVLQGAERAQGRELEFIVRSLVELKLQVEELRRRMDVETRVVQMAPGSPVMPAGWVGEVRPSEWRPALRWVVRRRRRVSRYGAWHRAPGTGRSTARDHPGCEYDHGRHRAGGHPGGAPGQCRKSTKGGRTSRDWRADAVPKVAGI